ncbi:MAG: hypothetical protein HZY76_21745 [Anaerolineae bacterium]|nr:MAG: hypothetical protein HZY76_21745 [Anaerolineae bacterium]
MTTMRRRSSASRPPFHTLAQHTHRRPGHQAAGRHLPLDQAACADDGAVADLRARQDIDPCPIQTCCPRRTNGSPWFTTSPPW